MPGKIFNYILKNFETAFNIDSNEFDIHYGIDKKSKIQIKIGNVAYFNRLEILDLSDVKWHEWKGEKIPFLFDAESFASIITNSESQVTINYDIIASSFYFLSNWQEHASKDKDIYGRFRMTESIQYKLDFISKPIVNYYFDILKCAIENAYDIKLKERLWEGKKMAICLTHDIDLCESAWIQGSYRELLKGNIYALLKLSWAKLFANDAWFNFSEIVEIEKRFNANSTFFFLAYKGSKMGIPNADYNISRPKFRKVFNMIRENGSEIAIHGSIGTSTDADLLKSEVSIIGLEVRGNRYHFLMYDPYSSPFILSESGLKYDSTLGFAESIGLRNSYCLPFYLFDIKNNRSTNIIEIPLTVMDVSFGERYMNITKEKALIMMRDLVDEIENFNGCFTLLWHNTYFSEYKYTGWKNNYCKILEYCAGKDALMTCGENICNLIGPGD
jgi:hypothetical protein